MIAFAAVCRLYSERTLFAGPSETVSYSAFAGLVETAKDEFEASRPEAASPVLIDLDWTAASFARFVAALLSGRSVALVPDLPDLPLSPFLAESPLVILRTGGTTGQPRHVVHAAGRLLGGYRVEERLPVRLMVLYAAGHIAGLDAFFQAVHRGSTLVIPPDRRAVSIASALERHQVEVLPATPTFLQFLLLSGELTGRRLDSVTTIPHGAEPMPPALRERIRAAFPKARLLQRFGLTELGPLPVREDPADPQALFLDPGESEWKVEDGELLIRSPARMLGTLEDGPVSGSTTWHATGDLAELTKRGSIRILGRREAVINVGGEKVIPETVEALLLDLPQVQDVAVTGIPNPLTGQAVCARVVFAGPPDSMALLRAARLAARERGLSIAHVPTKVEPAESIDRTAIGKRARAQGKA